MSKIPYIFKAIPIEFLTDDFIEDIPMMKIIRYIFNRIKYEDHEEIFTNNRNITKINLKAYQFVFGREKCAQECQISDKQVRVRIEKLSKSGFIERASSSTSTFTVYTLLTSSFTHVGPAVGPAVRASSYCSLDILETLNDKNKGQQLGPAVIIENQFPKHYLQGIEQREGQQLGHNNRMERIDKHMIDDPRAGEREEKISFRSKGKESAVVSISRKEVFEVLQAQMYTLSEIEQAIQTAKDADAKILPGCIPRYLATVIKNSRTKHEQYKPQNKREKNGTRYEQPTKQEITITQGGVKIY